MEHPSGLSVTEHVPAHRRPGDPVVVFVHGALDRSTSFARVVRRLPDLHTLAYDRRGYHRSNDALPLNTTLDGHVDDLLAVIGGRPAVVVGHSFGGTVALAAALRHDPPSTIVSLAAFEPPLPWLEVWTRQAPARRVRPPGQDPAEAKDARRADGPALVAELDAIRLDEAPFDVTAMPIPSLFGRGELSIDRHRQGVAWLADHVPGSELMDIPGAAHGAHLSHPDGFAGFVRRAVDRSAIRIPDGSEVLQ